jgi:hypothetical protein
MDGIKKPPCIEESHVDMAVLEEAYVTYDRENVDRSVAAALGPCEKDADMRPPAGLRANERALWREIVNSLLVEFSNPRFLERNLMLSVAADTLQLHRTRTAMEQFTRVPCPPTLLEQRTRTHRYVTRRLAYQRLLSALETPKGTVDRVTAETTAEPIWEHAARDYQIHQYFRHKKAVAENDIALVETLAASKHPPDWEEFAEDEASAIEELRESKARHGHRISDLRTLARHSRLIKILTGEVNSSLKLRAVARSYVADIVANSAEWGNVEVNALGAYLNAGTPIEIFQRHGSTLKELNRQIEQAEKRISRNYSELQQHRHARIAAARSTRQQIDPVSIDVKPLTYTPSCSGVSATAPMSRSGAPQASRSRSAALPPAQ